MIKRRKFFTLIGIVCLISSNGFAQSYVESALLFSRTVPGGSARIQGMGGTQIALGGDYSSGLSNPAGLGMYNRSEFTLSPGLSFYDTRAQYVGTTEDATRSSFNIPGLSLVFNMPLDKNGFVGGSFGISLSRTNDFNRNTQYQGSDGTSIIDYFIADAAGSTTAQFDGFQFNTPTGLAYFNYLIGPSSILDPPGSDTEYFSDVLTIPDQREEIETRGATNQWSLSYGANFKDILFVGGGIGISTLRYRSTKIYSEVFNNDVLMNDIFNDLRLDESLEVDGNGINATLGAIVRPVDFVQLGVSFTSPTYYELNEVYSASMRTSWNNFDYYGDGSEILNNRDAATDIVMSEYSLTTPMKLSTGVAFLSKYGFVGGDVEFINPSKTRYSSQISGVSFSQENEDIRATLKSVVNYRIGGEFRYNILRVRGGYSMQSSTYQKDLDLDNSIRTITGGIGMRLQKFFVDLALVQSKSDVLYQPYNAVVDGIPNAVVEIENKIMSGILTLGFTF